MTKVSCTISGGLVITFISSALVKVDFFVFNIVPSTWLNDNGTGMSGYDRTSAMSTLRSSERNKILPNKSLIRHAEIILPIPTLIFLVPPSVANECMVWRFVLLLNLVGFRCIPKYIYSFLIPKFLIYLIKTRPFFCETNLPVAMLNKYRGLIIPKWFTFALTISSIWPNHILLFFMLCGFRVDVISSFFVMFNLVNKFDMTGIRKKWDSGHHCLADMELVNDDIPVPLFAASALMVCSSAKSMGLLENDVELLFMQNIPFLNSWYTSACVSGATNRLL